VESCLGTLRPSSTTIRSSVRNTAHELDSCPAHLCAYDPSLPLCDGHLFIFPDTCYPPGRNMIQKDVCRQGGMYALVFVRHPCSDALIDSGRVLPQCNRGAASRGES